MASKKSEPTAKKPIKPAAWLSEVKPDADVMAIFYNRAPAPAPKPAEPTEPGDWVPSRDETGHPVTQNWAPSHPVTQKLGTQSETADDTGCPETGHPVQAKLGAQSPVEGTPSGDLGAQFGGNWAPSRGEQPARAIDAAYPSRQHKSRLNLRLPTLLSEEFEEYCRRKKLAKQHAAEIAIRMLMASDWAPSHPVSGHPLTGHLGDWVPKTAHDHDDDKMMIIYTKMTGNRATTKDREAAKEVASLSIRIVEEGIRLSLQRAPAPIKSFRYCLGAIWEAAGRQSLGPAQGTASVPSPPPAAAPPNEPARDDRSELLLMVARIREMHRGESLSKDDLRRELGNVLAVQGREVDDRLLDEVAGLGENR